MPLCEWSMPPEQAQKFSAQIESATGLPCPCKRGLRCPFIKLDGDEAPARPGEQPQPAAPEIQRKSA